MKVQKTSDMVYITRCRDCKYCDVGVTEDGSDIFYKCLGIRYGGVLPDWYCEHGEPEEGEQ